MIQSTAMPETSPAVINRSLHGLLFRVTGKDMEGKVAEVEKRFNDDDSRKLAIMAVRHKLDTQGIAFTTIEEPLPGKGPELEEVGIAIRGTDIPKCLSRGAILYSPNALSGQSFEMKKNRGHETLIARPSGDDEGLVNLQSFLNRHGIKFQSDVPEAGSLQITDPMSIRAIALCGGHFTGAEKYVETSRRVLG